jgi:hypothetical protein
MHTIKDIPPLQCTQLKPLLFQHMDNLLLEDHHSCRNPGCCLRSLILSVRLSEMTDLNLPSRTCSGFIKLPDFAGIIYRNCCMRKISISYVSSSPSVCGQKETPRKMENQQLVSPSLQCSSTLVGFGQCKNTGTLAGSSWFLLFPWMKSASNWLCFTNAINSIKNVTEKLKMLSQNGFQECFQ